MSIVSCRRTKPRRHHADISGYFEQDGGGTIQMSIGSYSDINSFLAEAKKKKVTTTADFEAEKVDDSCGKMNEGSAAWQKSEGKNKSGGLNEKGRKSYERENPGSDLKAPSKKKGNKRRASFCARMKGMKKKLTSAKTASDPDSRINKSLRAWNC